MNDTKQAKVATSPFLHGQHDRHVVIENENLLTVTMVISTSMFHRPQNGASFYHVHWFSVNYAIVPQLMPSLFTREGETLN